MEQIEFATKLQELVAEQGKLIETLTDTVDNDARLNIMLEIKDNLRAQDSLRESYMK